MRNKSIQNTNIQTNTKVQRKDDRQTSRKVIASDRHEWVSNHEHISNPNPNLNPNPDPNSTLTITVTLTLLVMVPPIEYGLGYRSRNHLTVCNLIINSVRSPI